MSDFENRESIEKRHVDPEGKANPIEDIRAEIDSDFGKMLIVIDDVGDLPIDASVRANGVFDDPMACFEWLLGWGCSMDGDGNPVSNGLVYAVRSVDPDTGEVEYNIYVKDSSP